MDEPICELCGEQPATVKLLEAAACDDCAADEIRKALLPTMGKCCCSISRNRNNGFLQTCLAPYGVEHDH